jgi:hypothetical protein
MVVLFSKGKRRMKKIYFIFLLMLCTSLFASDLLKTNLTKPSTASTKYFDVSRISCPIQNNGIWGRHPETGNADLLYDGVSIIFTSGLWIAAKVDGNVRASAADYHTDFSPGALDEKGIPFGYEDSTVRVYKISKRDNLFNNQDYVNWPNEFGAPTKNGKPWLLGDQTLWCSFTDAYQVNRNYNPCPPLKAEVHLTVWGSEFLEDVMFMRWELYNKSEDLWQDTYAGFFIDPDVADANYNLVGSDSTSKMTYCFEHNERQRSDSTFAVGYVLLESPLIESVGDTAITFAGVVPDNKNATVLSPLIYKHRPYEWTVVPYRKKVTNIWTYRRLAGQDTAGNVMVNPITAKKTKWGLSGDPVTQTGWIDDDPHDRFMMISTGPFNSKPDESSALTIAIIVVTGSSYFETVPKLKARAKEIRFYFKNSIDVITGVPSLEREKKRTVDINFFQNYPNPFNPKTTINFSLQKAEQVRLKIYNIWGQEIITLIDEELTAGIHSIPWDGNNSYGHLVGTGVYLAKLSRAGKSQVIKIAFVK